MLLRLFAPCVLGFLFLQCAAAQYVPGPLFSISGISNDRGAGYLTSQGAATTSTAPGGFVKRTGATLSLNGEPYTYNGLNNYYLLQKSLINSTRQQVTDVFELAVQLNLTVLRTWAFTDGPQPQQFAPIQPQLGMLDSKALSEGLDYIVAQAEQYGIKLILTLTNYFAQYGGVQQYVEFNQPLNSSNSSTVSAFYQQSNYQSQFKDYITAIVLRKNSITGRVYRDDPTIFAWDVINEPANPGDATGTVLYNWLSMMTAYVKSIDSNHLVYYGTPAFFGASSSPALIQLDGNYSGQYSPYASTYPFMGICQGEDWVRNLGIPSIDLASYHLYPNNGVFENQVVEAQLAAHLQQASAAGKPMILDEFNRKRPVSARNTFLSLVYGMVKASGSPVVGTNIWMPVSSTYPDYDGFEIYGDTAGTSQPVPPGQQLTAAYAQQLALEALFRNFVDTAACIVSQVQGNDYVDGFQETLSIIQNQS